MEAKSLKVPGIYGFINLVNGNCYVGSSEHLKHRFESHFLELAKCRHGNSHLQRAWNKYGPEAFCCVVFEFVNDVTMLLEREQYWIDNVDSCYNIHKIAGSPRGMKASEETKDKLRVHTAQRWKCPQYREKMIDLAKSLKQTEEAKKRISEAAKKQWTEKRELMMECLLRNAADPEVRKKVSAGLTGRKMSVESREKMAEAKRRRWQDPEYRKRMSDAKKGTKQTAETIRKRAAAVREYHRKRREKNEEDRTGNSA